MSGFAEPKHDAAHFDNVSQEVDEKGLHQHEVLSDKELLTDAANAENREHEMTLLGAVKDHPMACFWAFVFCFTIVSSDFTSDTELELTGTARLWSRSTCSSTETSSPSLLSRSITVS